MIIEGAFGYRRTSNKKRVSVEHRNMTKFGTTRITVMVTASTLRQIDAFVDLTQYLNRSEFIRHAIREHITREIASRPMRKFLEEYYNEKHKEKTT